jgi:hypothetical protein
MFNRLPMFMAKPSRKSYEVKNRRTGGAWITRFERFIRALAKAEPPDRPSPKKARRKGRKKRTSAD